MLINAGVLLLLTLLHAMNEDVFAAFRAIFALIPIMVVRGWVWQLVSYSFLHEGILHLLFNMLGLWMFGAQFEQDWGSKKFL
ncbi:MAG TPA: rhomboid family intramembrane serine protease, partial [Bryobacteraceae bacterium]|nr:rhomboid family intramembrane serine protease [Bryobacteraceae bacterium]